MQLNGAANQFMRSNDVGRFIEQNDNEDGIDRRGFLKCMAWAGTGLVWTLVGGVPKSFALGQPVETGARGELSFVQISDSHIGFSKPANQDVTGTLQAAVSKINALSTPPAFLIHTGDISHLAKAEEFDTADQLLSGIKTGQRFYVPGEHDVAGDNGKAYLDRYGKGSLGHGWYSFTEKGVHFIGLVNVFDTTNGGLGLLGAEQLEWLAKDLMPLKSSTPLVVFAHVPLWSVYPDWGWGTADSEQALALMRRFGSVTVLNGHIHQTLQKVEGNVAFPQPAPGSAPHPGPMTVPPDALRKALGITQVSTVRGGHSLAVVDSSLA
jgi:3',5'-cyclic AMP phosphodiesterase CpdA